MNGRAWLLAGAAAIGAVWGTASCSGDDSNNNDAGDAGNDVVQDVAPDVRTTCDDGLAVRAFASGPYGVHRGDVSDDFSVPLTDGTTWSLKAAYDGCESYVFVPDVAISDTNVNSIWTKPKDLATLVNKSAKNVHYFFLSTKTNGLADTNIANQDAAIQTLLGGLSADQQAVWSTHLHVVQSRVQDLGNWMSTAVPKYLQLGFAIDRTQQIRGLGTLADVTRQNSTWFDNNLAYASYEGDYMNATATRAAALAAENAKVVTLFGAGISHVNADGGTDNGAVMAQFVEADAQLPSAQEMAGYDTLEIEVTQLCPDPNTNEFNNNCGAWDYLASLWVAPINVTNDAGADAGPPPNIEVARFITAYHREAHWVVDATPMLAEFASGGTRHFRWDFAPPWNVQPAITNVSMRLSNQKKTYAPAQKTFLYAGGTFDDQYNVGRTPTQVQIPASAKHVELWAIITGHGGDPITNCSEFCNHEHHFTVGSSTYTKDFPMAQTQTGCVADTANMMTPNQGGTWWYGRGGWCPGAPVVPWVTDVTKDAPAGQTVTVSYQGTLGGQTPPAADAGGTGNIDMVSYLVVYE
jgi:hypothetical protein